MQKSAISWNMRQIKKMMENNTLKFSNPIQRGYCWDVKRASLLIDTLIRDYITPPMYTIKIKDENGNIYDGIDGKQRCTTVYKFLKDEFKLGDMEQVEVNGDMMDISGLKFSELPEELQDKINTYTFTVYMLDDVTDEEIEEIMHRLNNGKVLNSYEHSRIKAADLGTIQKVAKHPFFNTILTESAINKYANEQIIVQSKIVLDEKEPCLDAGFVTKFMLNLELSDEDIRKLNLIFDKLNLCYQKIKLKKIKKLLAKRTHLVSFVPATLKAVEEEWDDQEFAEFIQEFLADMPDKYSEACVQGSGHTNNVKARLVEVEKAMEDYQTLPFI